MLAEIFGVDGVVVLVVALIVLFGSSQIPRLAKSLGSARREFKAGLDESGPYDASGGRQDRSSPA
jgi:sec-independent protein translocase protein TatA